MSEKWKKIDANQTLPVYLSAADECYYARDYVSHGSYKSSPGNGLITNFKKDVSRKGKREWQYKVDAINKFAAELKPLLPNGMAVAHIPSSKCKTDPQYDSRLEDTLRALKRLNASLIIESPLTSKNTVQASHLGGDRNPEIFYNNLAWVGLSQPTTTLVLIDDVITTGAHFKACQRKLTEQSPGIRVLGVFWAKTVWIADDADEPTL